MPDKLAKKFGGNSTKQPAFQNQEFRMSGDLINTDRVMNGGFWMGIWPIIIGEMINYMVDKLTRTVAGVLK